LQIPQNHPKPKKKKKNKKKKKKTTKNPKKGVQGGSDEDGVKLENLEGGS